MDTRSRERLTNLDPEVRNKVMESLDRPEAGVAFFTEGAPTEPSNEPMGDKPKKRSRSELVGELLFTIAAEGLSREVVRSHEEPQQQP